MNRDRFSRFEERIEQLVEGSFARLFGNRLHPREVAVKLARAVEDNIRAIDNGQWEAPNLFDVFLNPDDLSALLEAQPELSVKLAETVVDLANRAEVRLPLFPSVQLRPDPGLALHEVRISARHASGPVRATQVLQSITTPEEEAAPRNAHLILHGTQSIPLERTVTNIGRKHDNHVVISDIRVSRVHAQIRLRFGRYVLYDLGSTGGTYVNNHRVKECILHTGDVVSLSGVTLVYVDDDASSQHHKLISDTQLRPPVAKPDAADDAEHDT